MHLNKSRGEMLFIELERTIFQGDLTTSQESYSILKKKKKKIEPTMPTQTRFSLNSSSSWTPSYWKLIMEVLNVNISLGPLDHVWGSK